MTDYEVFPKLCVKCKRSDVELHKFTYSRTKKNVGSKSSITRFLSFPVCSSCKKDFEKSCKFETLFFNLKYPAIVSVLILIYSLVEILRGSTFWLINILLVITSSIVFLEIALYIKLKLDPNRVKKYIDLKSSGEVYIKDEELQQKLKEKLISEREKEILERTTGIGTITCPKCGSKQPIGIDFCNNCGKELRNLY